ncbi:MAG: type IV secretion system DNA-binding domain-containing protein [Steroidobacteraceae bacterium]
MTAPLPAPPVSAIVAFITFKRAYLVALAAVLAGCIAGRAPWRRYLLGSLLLALIAVLFSSLFAGLLSLILPDGIAAIIGFASGLPVAYGLGHHGLPIPAFGEPKHQRGTVITAPAHTTRPQPGAHLDSSTLTLAGHPVPPHDETKHFKFLGTTGTGKSTAIRELLAGALARHDRAIIADPDAAYRARFFNESRGDLILNPFEDRSPKWDLFAEIRDPYDFDQLARSLIPDGTGDERTWRQYAQIFLTAVMRQSYRSGLRDNAGLYRLITSAPIDELQNLLEDTPAQPFVASGNERMFGSIRSVTISAISALAYINDQRTQAFSIRRWIKEGRGVLFLPYRAGQIAALRTLISTWMHLAIVETMTLPEGDAKLWFIIDELDALGPIEGLKDALPRIRKFGGRCVLGFQSISQVGATFGHAEADTMIENCGNTLILRCSASEGGGTASFASKLIGEREIIRKSISHSHPPKQWFATKTVSEHHVIESAVLPSEIEQIPDLQGYLKFASTPHWVYAALRP